MKSAIVSSLLLLAAVFAAAGAARASVAQEGQRGRLRLESLERLAPKADQSVNIELDGILIKLAGSLLSDKDEDERAVKEFVTGLKGVYVRSYEFKSEGRFAEADIAAVREQLRAPAWSRVLNVKSGGVDFGDAEVYVANDGGRVEGLALLVVEPKEVTVINIVGAVDLDKLKRLEGNLRLPRVHVKRKK